MTNQILNRFCEAVCFRLDRCTLQKASHVL